MAIKKEINDLVKKIKSAHKGGKFPAYIESIRFPYYKNLIRDAEIKFDFPFTVLIGANGSGKSSALHAIYGCPDRKSTGDHWFSTPLDPIKQNRIIGEIPSIIYTYKQRKKILEVIKRRSGVAKGLDYWETSRPIVMYGMESLEDGKRNPPIKKEVKFLDFRSELSAFDKFFHFGQFKSRKTITSKQDYLRKYTEYVKRSFASNSPISVYNKSSKKPQKAGDSQLEALSDILGKSYSACKIMFHNFYGEDGATVHFFHHNKAYSEAFAGRGEYAVVKLVYELSRVGEGSLIILDEPEVSLHPLAQEKLKLHLLKICLEKKLQIVISTHSPKLVEFFPNEAIKLFFEEDNGQFNISNNCSYYEAFHHIGEKINNEHKKTIVVEDNIAKEIIESIIKEMGGDYPLLFQVHYYPGGAEDLFKSSVFYSQENEINKYIILDGDKKKPQLDPQTLTIEQSQDIGFLETKIREITNCDFNKLGFRLDGNGKMVNQEQKAAAIINYFKFNNDHIAYFPLMIPEQLIWDDEYAQKLLFADGLEMPENTIEYKQKFVEFSALFSQSTSSESINDSQIRFVKNFIRKKDENYNQIVEILKRFHG